MCALFPTRRDALAMIPRGRADRNEHDASRRTKGPGLGAVCAAAGPAFFDAGSDRRVKRLILLQACVQFGSHLPAPCSRLSGG
jgi:hypothetical protein